MEDVKLTIHRTPIKVEKTSIFVIIDQSLTWSAHIDQVIARCNKRLNLLRVMAGSR